MTHMHRVRAPEGRVMIQRKLPLQKEVNLPMYMQIKGKKQTRLEVSLSNKEADM